MKPYFIGVDLGTTAVKVVLFEETGIPCAVASEEIPLLYPHPGEIEQSPSCWYEIPCSLIRKVCENIDPSAVRAIGISSQGISVVPVDAQFHPLQDGISCLDTRAEAELKQILNTISAKELFNLTGKHASASYTLPKLLWLKHHRPHIFSEASLFLLPLDYITARLCGNAATDSTMAGGTMLYTLQDHCWSSKLCELFGIPEEKLPHVQPTSTIAGQLNDISQRLTGLSADVMVAVGAQDQKIAAYGADITAFPGLTTMSLGTAGALEILCDQPSDVLPTFDFHTNDQVWYMLEACINTFGAAIKWARDLVFSGLSYSEMDALAEATPPGSCGVKFYPHLSGISTPHFGRKPLSGWKNLALTTDRGCMIRALYEGLACEVRLNLEAMIRAGAPVERLRIFGGGSKSKILCQILSDITQIPLEAMDFTETAAFGASKAAWVCYHRETGITPSVSFCIPSEKTLYTPSQTGEGIYRSYCNQQDYAE